MMNFETGQDGVATYTTIDGDVVDAIAFAYYQTQAGTAEAVLAYNPGLAALMPYLPAGVVIRMPAIDTSVEPIPQIHLWD